jgi:hypothetical protein
MGGLEVLILALCLLAAVWLFVLFGARFFGPRDQ